MSARVRAELDKQTKISYNSNTYTRGADTFLGRNVLFVKIEGNQFILDLRSPLCREHALSTVRTMLTWDCGDSDPISGPALRLMQRMLSGEIPIEDIIVFAHRESGRESA